MSRILTYTVKEEKEMLLTDKDDPMDRLKNYYGVNGIKDYGIEIVKIKRCKCERCGSSDFIEYRWHGEDEHSCCMNCNTR